MTPSRTDTAERRTRRLSPEARRRELVEAGAALFAERGYDDVSMDDVAERADASRALAYRHFGGKRDLFAAVYAEAAGRLLEQSPIDAAQPLEDQVRAGLDAHLDYFLAHRRTVIAANRTLAGDPVIQAIITDELTVLRTRLLDVLPVPEELREEVSSVLMSWLVFVRAYSVDWLVRGAPDRSRIREACTGALFGALMPLLDATPRTSEGL